LESRAPQRPAPRVEKSSQLVNLAHSGGVDLRKSAAERCG
jgi:hypothetical protein